VFPVEQLVPEPAVIKFTLVFPGPAWPIFEPLRSLRQRWRVCSVAPIERIAD
jgi:hypothetical protein